MLVSSGNIYITFYIIVTSFCYIIECVPVVLASCVNIYIYTHVYIYVLKTKVNQKVTITFIKSTYIQLK